MFLKIKYKFEKTEEVDSIWEKTQQNKPTKQTKSGGQVNNTDATEQKCHRLVLAVF